MVVDTTTNYGWTFVNSGADPVSGPANFAHVQQIDTTLKSLLGDLMSVRHGDVRVMPNGQTGEQSVVSYAVTFDTPMIGEEVQVFFRSGTARPDTIHPPSALDVTTTGFTMYTSRPGSSTEYTVWWTAMSFSTP